MDEGVFGCLEGYRQGSGEELGLLRVGNGEIFWLRN